jgi:hypothetical protein
MTHPHQLAAIAALSALRHAHPLLAAQARAEAYSSPIPRRTRTVAPSERQQAARAVLLRSERGDRVHGARAGLAPAGASPAPVRAALLDAQVAAETLIGMLCWDVADLLRHQPPPYVDARRAHIRYSTFDARCAYLASGVRWVPPAQADRIARQLARADRTVRAVLGIGPDRRPLPGDRVCPACGQTTLRAEISSPDERDWTIACLPPTGRCECLGSQCSCRRPGREPGLAHIWPAEEYAANFGALRPYLLACRAVEAGALTLDGLVWATAEDLRRVLGADVDPARWAARLQQWRRRGQVQAVRRGRANWYRLDQTLARNAAGKAAA